MHVVVLGTGVIGVTTAYYLAREGHRVTLVDRADAVAEGASHANGGQLSYSFTDALGRPGFLLGLPRALCSVDPAIRVRPRLNGAMTAWGVRFIGQCTSRRAAANTLAMLEITLRSARLLAQLRRDVPLEFAFREAGKMVLLRSAREVQQARAASELKGRHGCRTRVLGVDAATEIEPAIKAMRGPFAGAVYSSDDQVGDAAAFCRGLSAWLVQHTDTRLRLGHRIDRLVTRGGQMVAVDTEHGAIDGDAFVVCLGAWSPQLLQPVGIRPAIVPMRGYSVTLPVGDRPPAVSVTDPRGKIVFSRMNGNLRIAGFADFVSFDCSRDAQRIETLLSVARQVAPDAAQYAATDKQSWGGFRPLTPGGVPLVEPTGIGGLYLNTGHGMLGWTMACASGFDVARAISRSAPGRV